MELLFGDSAQAACSPRGARPIWRRKPDASGSCRLLTNAARVPQQHSNSTLSLSTWARPSPKRPTTAASFERELDWSLHVGPWPPQRAHAVQPIEQFKQFIDASGEGQFRRSREGGLFSFSFCRNNNKLDKSTKRNEKKREKKSAAEARFEGKKECVTLRQLCAGRDECRQSVGPFQSIGHANREPPKQTHTSLAVD